MLGSTVSNIPVLAKGIVAAIDQTATQSRAYRSSAFRLLPKSVIELLKR
jgi:hypothetical protein